MALPIIKFRGVRYKAGEHEGWRPSLEKATKVADLALAEEIVLKKRMSMSPDELYHAIRTTLETVPELVAEDGRERVFTKLVTYGRSVSGKLESEGGAWNESCRCRVRASLMKDCKLPVNCDFRNVVEQPKPVIRSIAWNGAQLVENVVKVGSPFTAYGRNMLMLPGDSASIRVGDEQRALYCTESDVAHATFSWPTAFAPEAGSPATFVMFSTGGVEGGEHFTVSKPCTVIAADVLPSITVSSFTFDRAKGTMHIVGEHLDAVAGYHADPQGGSAHFIPANVLTNDIPVPVEFRTTDGRTGMCDAPEGFPTVGMVSVVLTPDPSKSRDQEPIVVDES